VLFSTFAEAIAEGRGKAQAESLKKTKKEVTANKVVGDQIVEVNGHDLVKGDVVRVSAREVIPNDGEVIKGRGAVDESAITGESAPVIRESGGDFSSVTGGTTLLSDELIIRITANPGESSHSPSFLLASRGYSFSSSLRSTRSPVIPVHW
jgi:K+-transporting ATPase ATPase B chain